MQPFPKRDFSEYMTSKSGISVFDLRGRLLREIPRERYRSLDRGNAVPEIGDIVGLDQGFTGEDGKPMTLVYGFGSSGEYEAELYDSDFEMVARD